MQTAGAWDEFVAEVGDNYAFYHRFVADLMEDLGGMPSPVAGGGVDKTFNELVKQAVWLVFAEAKLRICRAHRLDGASLSEPAQMSPPLVDERHRLVSVETGQAEPGHIGDVSQDAWRPTPVADSAMA